MKHVKVNKVSLREHKDINEIWIHDQIVKDPTLLGLGDVIVKDRERGVTGGGRLDLLLQDIDGHGRYEVEIQLGATDPSHIIRTIEYWDYEKKRSPKYDHTAVIVAEDITTRFLNVIGLFNGTIPIIALQMTALQQPDGIGLIFTKILDTFQVDLDEEDEESHQPTDRPYWEARGSINTVKMADEILALCTSLAPKIELNYNKYYIGFRVDGRAYNFASCRPRKTAMNLNIKIPKSEKVDKELDSRSLDLLDYDTKWKEYRIKLSPEDLEKNAPYLKELLKQAFEVRHKE